MLAVRYHVARQTHSNEEADIVNIQIFGTKKSFDTKKAQRYFKEPIVRNGRAATVGYAPDVWKTWE